MKLIIKAILITLSICIFLLFLICIYNFYRNVSDKNIFCKKPTLGYEMQSFSPSKLQPLDNIYRFSYHFFLYIHDFTYKFSRPKQVFCKGSPSKACPSFYLHPKLNIGIVSIFTDKGLKRFRLQNIPLRKWNHIALCVNEGEVDIYLNGLLAVTGVLGANPQVNSESLNIGERGGFSGLICRLCYSPKYLNASIINVLSKYRPSCNQKYFASLTR